MLAVSTVALGAAAGIAVALTAVAGTAAAGSAAAGTAGTGTAAAGTLTVAGVPPACTVLPPGPGAGATAPTVRLCVRVTATRPVVRAGHEAGYLVSVWVDGGKAHGVSVRIAASSGLASPAVGAPVFTSCGGGSGAGTELCTFGRLTAGSQRASGLPAQVAVPASAPNGDQVTLSATAQGAASGGTPMSLTAAASVPVKAQPTPSPSPSPTRTSSPSPKPSQSPSPKPSQSQSPSPKPSNSRSPSPKPSDSKSPSPKPSHSRSPAPHASGGSAHPGGRSTHQAGGSDPGAAGTTQSPLPKLPSLDVPEPSGQLGQPTGPVGHLFPTIGASPSPAHSLSPVGSVFPRTGSSPGNPSPGAPGEDQARVTADDSSPTDAPLAGDQLAALCFLLVAAGLTAGAARAKVRRRG
jgi:hypothetical protein